MAAAVAAAAVPALPFASSGARVRSGYELVRTVSSLGLVSGFAGRVALVALAVLPLLAAGASVAASLRRGLVVATLTGMAGIVALGAGAVVWAATGGGSSPEVGPPAAVVAGVVALGMAVLFARSGPTGRVERS